MKGESAKSYETINVLNDRCLQTRPKNVFFSTKDLFVRKESILSGGCGENILTVGKVFAVAASNGGHPQQGD